MTRSSPHVSPAYDLLFTINVTHGFEEFSAENAAACSTADGVVGKTHELPVKECVGTESADGDTESALVVDIQLDLGTIVLFHVLDEVPGSVGKCKLLGKSAESTELLDQLLLLCLLSEIDKGIFR